MTDIRPPRLEGTIHLENGRHLGYAEYGPIRGRALIWLHGSPGARGQVPPLAREAAYKLNVRIIAIERPGIGHSTSHYYNSIAEWAHDVEEFCDAKGIDCFSVVGLSGGGPYALACAHELSERVVSVAILGGVAPTVGDDAAEGGAVKLSRTFSPLVKHMRAPMNIVLRGLVRTLEPFSEQAIELFSRAMPPGDRLIFSDQALRQMFIQDLITGSRHQMQAIFHDAYLFGRDWGFALKDIRVPVHMWYGDADNIVPVEHGQHMADKIPDSVLRVRKEEGHLGGLGAAVEIMGVLLSHWPEQKKPTPRRKSN